MHCVYFNHDYMYYCYVACSLMSISGSLVIIYFYLSILEIRSHFTKIVLNLAVVGLIRSLCILVPCEKFRSDIIHRIVGILVEVTMVQAMFWSTYISISLHYVIVLRSQTFTNYFNRWCFFIYLVYPPLCCLPLTTNSYATGYSFCAINNKTVSYYWLVSIIYFPAFASIVASIYYYCLTWSILKSLSIDSRGLLVLKNLKLYPMLMIADLTPVAITRLVEIFGDNCNIYFMYFISSCIFSLNGFFSCLIFLSSKSLIDSIRKRKAAKKTLQIRESLNFVGEEDSRNLLIDSFVDSPK